MAWTTPRTWTTGETVTKAILDVHVRDNLQYLKDVLDGSATQAVGLFGNVGIGGAATTRTLTVQSATPDDHLFLCTVGPSIMLADATTAGTATKSGIIALATTAGHFGLGDGDLLIATNGASRGDIRINANYSGGGTHHLYLQPASGQTYLPDGSVGSPALAFGAGDPDTGMYRIGANNIGIATNGAKVLDIATSGLAVTGTLSATGTPIGAVVTGSYVGDATSNRTITIPSAPSGKSLVLLELDVPGNYQWSVRYQGSTSSSWRLTGAGGGVAQNDVAITGAATFQLNLAGVSNLANLSATTYRYVALFV